METSDILKYSDELDKSLGIAGMSIALLACDGHDCIASVSLNDSEPFLEFSPDAFFVANPRYSAKLAWSQLLRQLQLFSGMLIGNVMCRYYTAHRAMQSDLIDNLHNIIVEHAIELCDLDNDEIESLFNKDILYFRRLFSHPSVAEVARDFASTLRAQRRMTSGDVYESLIRLSSI